MKLVKDWTWDRDVIGFTPLRVVWLRPVTWPGAPEMRGPTEVVVGLHIGPLDANIGLRWW